MTGTRTDAVRPDGSPAGHRLEPMRWWDIATVVALEAELFARDSPWTAEMFWSELAMGHHYVVVRTSVGSVVGYAGLAVHGADRPGEEAQVQTIGVAADVRGTGLGGRLLDDLLAAAGRRRVVLEVRTDNDRARTLYERRGFTPIGVRRGYYQPSNADALVMQKEGR